MKESAGESPFAFDGAEGEFEGGVGFFGGESCEVSEADDLGLAWVDGLEVGERSGDGPHVVVGWIVV